MPVESIVCRKGLDERNGNPWVCRCPWCQEKRKEIEGQAPDAKDSAKLNERQIKRRKGHVERLLSLFSQFIGVWGGKMSGPKRVSVVLQL
jgi:hypothetical protein